MNYEEYLKQNPEFAARQKGKHSTPVVSAATTEPGKAPVSNGSTTSTNTTLYSALGFLFFIALALPLSIILGLMAKASFGDDDAFILAIVLSCIISFFPSAIFFFMGDVVKHLKEITEILKNR